MKEPHEVRELFINDEFIGRILRYTTLLEFDLDCLLTQYFIRDDRIQDGMTLLISDITFSRKIELLVNLPIRKDTKSYKSAVTGLRQFRKIRNIVAHTWTVSSDEVIKLLQVAELNTMLTQYPEGMKKSFIKTRVGLNRLLRTKEFANPHSEKPVDPGHFSIMKFFGEL